MYQKNRNLFSVIAILLSAGLISGMGGLFLVLSDHFGGRTRQVSDTTSTPAAAEASGVSVALSSPGGESALDINSPSPDSALLTGMTTLGSHGSAVLKIAGTTARPLVASGSYDNTVKVWPRAGAAESISLVHGSRVNDLSFTPDGDQIISGSGDGVLSLWDANSGDLVSSVSSGGRILSLAVDREGQLLASSSNSGDLTLWHMDQQLESHKVLKDIGPQIKALSFHPVNTTQLISGNQAGELQLWDVEGFAPLMTMTVESEQIEAVDISNNGLYVVSGGHGQQVYVWDLNTGERLQTLDGHDFVISDVAFSPDGTLIASASYDESVKVWDWANNKLLCTLKGHSSFVYSVEFTDSGNTLISGGYDGTVREWDLLEANGQNCLAAS